MFRIGFIEDSDGGPPQSALGKIALEDHLESFEASLHHWSRAAYQEQWRHAAERLVEGESRTAFFTSFAPPQAARFAVWWPAWREGQRIWITEQFLFFDQLDRPFDEADPYKHIGEREQISEGRRVSYWPVRLESFREFLRTVEV